MDKSEITSLLEALLREAERRRGLGGYSVDAPVMAFLVDSLAKLTLHVMQLEKQLNKRQARKK